MITTAQIFKDHDQSPCDPDFVAAHPDPREAISACLAKVPDRGTDASEWHHVRWACLVLCGREAWDAVIERIPFPGSASAAHSRALTEACAERLRAWLDEHYPIETEAAASEPQNGETT